MLDENIEWVRSFQEGFDDLKNLKKLFTVSEVNKKGEAKDIWCWNLLRIEESDNFIV